jgi:hydrogenase/urease accessory protein HupE
MIRLLCLLILLYAAPCFAHKLAPSLLEIDGGKSQQFNVLWRTPASSEQASPEPVLPESCSVLAGPTQRAVGTAIEYQWQLKCLQGLEGQDIQITGLTASRTAALIKISLADGRQYTQLIRRDNQTFRIPTVPSALAVVEQYFVLGVEHILIGLDHLLFVTGLLLLAASWRQLTLTITAFTVGHSATLVLVSLGIIPQVAAWVELAIAATILYLAVDLSYGAAGTRRVRWPIVAVFGLIHGLGFASVLAELGLPQSDVLTGLLSFNVGIEIGQLLFVGALALAFMLLRQLFAGAGPLMRNVAVYTMGGMAVFWCLDRGYGMLLSSLYYF